MKTLNLKSWLFSLLALSVVSICMTSCQKEVELANEQTLPAMEYAETTQILAEAMAQLVNEDQAWEDAIKQKTLELENGDYIFLYAFAKSMTVNGVTLANALAANSNESRDFFNTNITKDFPLMSIGYNIPNQNLENPMTLDVNTVYFETRDDDDYNDNQNITYFLYGKEANINYGDIDKKDDAFFIVRNNERIILVDQTNGSILNDATFEENYLTYEPFKNFFYSNEALIGSVNGMDFRLNAEIGKVFTGTFEAEINDRCQRDNHPQVRDGSTAIKYSHDREPAWKLGPEIRQRLTRVSISGVMSEAQFQTGRNYAKGLENMVLTFNYNAFLLDDDIHGNAYGWAWWEEDGGNDDDDRFDGSFEAELGSLGTFGFSYDFAKDNDDLYGNNEIDWCSDPQWWAIGDIEWWGGPTWW